MQEELSICKTMMNEILLIFYIISSQSNGNGYTRRTKRESTVEADSRSLDQPMTEQKWVRHSFSHTPGEKVTIASPSPAGEPPGQGGGGQPSTLEIHIDQSIFASCQFAK